MTKNSKVIVVGLDGGTLDLMEPWMNAGKLPTFAKIREQGICGKLRSTTPYYSAPAWVSMVTGCNPGKHGIYDFFHTDTFSKKLVNSRYRKTSAIWNHLTDAGNKSIIVNVPGTYPPESINGIMITGLLTPSSESEFTYPKSIKNDLVKDKIGEYELEQVAIDDIPKNLNAKYAPEKFADQVKNAIISHATVTINLMEKYEWDFTMVVLRSTDDAMHLLWEKEELILSCYQTADDYINRMMERYPDAIFIIVSDHGFGKPQKYLYVNNLLYNTGYLKTISNPNYNLSSLMTMLFDKMSRLIFHLASLYFQVVLAETSTSHKQERFIIQYVQEGYVSILRINISRELLIKKTMRNYAWSSQPCLKILKTQKREEHSSKTSIDGRNSTGKTQ